MWFIIKFTRSFHYHKNKIKKTVKNDRVNWYIHESIIKLINVTLSIILTCDNLHMLRRIEKVCACVCLWMYTDKKLIFSGLLKTTSHSRFIMKCSLLVCIEILHFAAFIINMECISSSLLKCLLPYKFCIKTDVCVLFQEPVYWKRRAAMN